MDDVPDRIEPAGLEPGWLEPGDASPASRARLRAWLALQRRTALHPQAARAALEEAGGDPAAALRRLCGVAPDAVLRDRELEALAARLARLDVHLLPFGSPAYPARIATLPDAAPLLGARGDLALLSLPLVAIVGARAATPYGVGAARRLARQLARVGVGVVSGLAQGVDAAAHRGALEERGATIAVLGCGPDRVYPAHHAGLADEVARRGLLLSELPPGAPPLPHHFPLRNRLISALVEAVVVVEARLRSGSLITAEHAAEQGREVLVVPGPIDAPTSEGTNRLLRDGARVAIDADDVLRAMKRDTPGPAAWAAPIPAEARELADSLRAEPATRDELAARFGLSAQELSRRLLLLELDGRVREGRDGRLRVAPV
jgi:DNA processing protein